MYYRTVYVVDHCRPPIIEYAKEQMNDAAQMHGQCADTNNLKLHFLLFFPEKIEQKKTITKDSGNFEIFLAIFENFSSLSLI